jgi:hypothetical protein
VSVTSLDDFRAKAKKITAEAERLSAVAAKSSDTELDRLAESFSRKLR